MNGLTVVSITLSRAAVFLPIVFMDGIVGRLFSEFRGLAAATRFRPTMMTSLAALLGTMPIALGIGEGAESRRPLGIAVEATE